MGETNNALPPHRHIRSFVKRDSRITKAQAKAIHNHLENYHFDSAPAQFKALHETSLEIGAGDGECILALAKKAPATGHVAAEVYRAGLGHLLLELTSANLTNLLVIDQDIVDYLPKIANESFDRIMVFFPDPWPKKRHHKRRLLQVDFLIALARILKNSGVLFIATDIQDYAELIRDNVKASNCWHNLAGGELWAPRPCFRVLTKFERKGLNEHRSVFELALAKKQS
ncbi:MAG: tRNA (guanosine(46)-N7)-methyltransferase TrmB [Pseudomonadota bacterium]